MIAVDSAYPPTIAAVNAAKAAGIGMWCCYISEIPHWDGILRPWSRSEIAVVQTLNPCPIAFCSGWDDPAQIKQTGLDWNVLPCVDVEYGIRDDGPWVQPWLDASGAGLYGRESAHVGRRARFHVASWYPGYDPKTTWPPSWIRPNTPLGWQWQNTHTEFGVGVDRSYLDDSFGGTMISDTLPLRRLLVQLTQMASQGHTAPSGLNLEAEAGAIKDDLSNVYEFLAHTFAPDQNQEAQKWLEDVNAMVALYRANKLGIPGPKGDTGPPGTLPASAKATINFG